MREFLKMTGERASGDVNAKGSECCGGGACQSEQKLRLMGRMENPTASAIITGHCGETMEMYLRIEGETIEDVRFYSDGCASSVACGSAAAEMAKGKNIDDASLIEGDTILMVLKELKPEDTHCAFLAAEALQTAIHHWMLQ